MKNLILVLATVLISSHAYADQYNHCLGLKGEKIDIQNHGNRNTSPHMVIYPKPLVGDGFQVVIIARIDGGSNQMDASGNYVQSIETTEFSTDGGTTRTEGGAVTLASEFLLSDLLQTGSGNIGVLTTQFGRTIFTCNFDWQYPDSATAQ